MKPKGHTFGVPACSCTPEMLKCANCGLTYRLNPEADDTPAEVCPDLPRRENPDPPPRSGADRIPGGEAGRMNRSWTNIIADKDGAERLLLRWHSVAEIPFPKTKGERNRLEKLLTHDRRKKKDKKKAPASFYGTGHAPKAIMGKANRYSPPTGVEVNEE